MPIDQLGFPNFFSGSIDDVRIYRRALTAEERECLYVGCPPPEVDLGIDRQVCEETPLRLSSPQEGSFRWSTGATDSTLTVNQSGTYWLRMENACGIGRSAERNRHIAELRQS